MDFLNASSRMGLEEGKHIRKIVYTLVIMAEKAGLRPAVYRRGLFETVAARPISSCTDSFGAVRTYMVLADLSAICLAFMV